MNELDLESIRYDDRGLIPAIIRESATGAILMVAWMNEESLRMTRERGETHFWSRSRGEFWHKGATSGNRQRVVHIATDCDADVLLIDVVSSGPACHSGDKSCFGNNEADRLNLAPLMATLRSRRLNRPPESYSTQLFDSGLGHILEKVAEEAAEVVAAGKSESNQRLVEESADLLYHLAVLLVERGVGLEEIAGELEYRSGKSGIRAPR